MLTRQAAKAAGSKTGKPSAKRARPAEETPAAPEEAAEPPPKKPLAPPAAKRAAPAQPPAAAKKVKLAAPGQSAPGPSAGASPAEKPTTIGEAAALRERLMRLQQENEAKKQAIAQHQTKKDTAAPAPTPAPAPAPAARKDLTDEERRQQRAARFELEQKQALQATAAADKPDEGPDNAAP